MPRLGYCGISVNARGSRVEVKVDSDIGPWVSTYVEDAEIDKLISLLIRERDKARGAGND